MPGSTVHIAGHPMLIGTTLIQRCIACGYALINVDTARCACPSDQDNSLPGYWELGAFIEVSGVQPVQSIKVGMVGERLVFEQPWENCCRRDVIGGI